MVPRAVWIVFKEQGAMNHHQLSLAQLQRLKEHKYRSQGTSVSEVFMQPYWRWLVTKVPLWVAPNLITFVGLVMNLFTTVLVVLYDLNCEGAVSVGAGCIVRPQL